MSRKFFTVLVLTVCLTLAAGMAWGTGARAGSTSAGSSGRIPITWVTYQTGPLDANPSIIEFFNEKFNIDIQVWQTEAADATNQLNLWLAANQIPDYFRGELANLPRYHEQGVLAEIPEATFRNNAPLVYNEFQETLPGFLNYYKVNGKLYAVPRNLNRPARQVAVYRGDWIRNVGKTGYPTTLAELEELVYLFANSDPDRNGVKDTYGLSVTAFNLVYGAYGYIRGQWNDVNGSLVYSSIQPEMKEALAVLARWYRDGVIDPEFITGENKGGYWALPHAFIEGRIGVSSHGSAYHWNREDPDGGQIYREMRNVNPAGADSMVFGVPVTGPAGKKGLSMGNTIDTDMNCFGIQVERTPEKMAKFFELQNWINENLDNYIYTHMGQKGVTWDFNANGIPVTFDGRSAQSQGGQTITVRQYRASLEAQMNPIRLRFINDNGLYYDGLQTKLILPNPSDGIYKTELTRIEDAVFIDIITGQRPISYFDEFVAQWRRSGGDILTREANDWYRTVR